MPTGAQQPLALRGIRQSTGKAPPASTLPRAWWPQKPTQSRKSSHAPPPLRHRVSDHSTPGMMLTLLTALTVCPYSTHCPVTAQHDRVPLRALWYGFPVLHVTDTEREAQMRCPHLGTETVTALEKNTEGQSPGGRAKRQRQRHTETVKEAKVLPALQKTIPSPALQGFSGKPLLCYCSRARGLAPKPKAPHLGVLPSTCSWWVPGPSVVAQVAQIGKVCVWGGGGLGTEHKPRCQAGVVWAWATQASIEPGGYVVV